jgi:hypothetical protein
MAGDPPGIRRLGNIQWAWRDSLSPLAITHSVKGSTAKTRSFNSRLAFNAEQSKR